MRLEAGFEITPNVRLVRCLRKGGMGSVWVAEHLALRNHVAVKFMAVNHARQTALVTRFTREATYTAQIKSPHVIQVHDHGVTEQGLPFIVMELLEGEDLAERLQRLGPMPPLEVARILNHLCKVLGKAHQVGIIHRDVKPSNVFLLDEGDEVFTKLLDFGVAKQHGDKGLQVTGNGDLVGTLAYMSPEQITDAREVDLRSDLWSVGVVAYRALTGALPFSTGDGVGALMLALSEGTFTPVSQLRPDLPLALDGWFLRALARDPAERFASAREMSEAFDLAMGLEPRSAKSTRSAELLAQRAEAAKQGVRTVAPTLVEATELTLPASVERTLPSPVEPSGAGSSPVESSSNTAVMHVQEHPGAGSAGAGSLSLLRVAAAGLAVGVVGVLSVALLTRGQPTSPKEPASESSAAVTSEASGTPPTPVPSERVEPQAPPVAPVKHSPSSSPAPPTAPATSSQAPTPSATASVQRARKPVSGNPAVKYEKNKSSTF